MFFNLALTFYLQANFMYFFYIRPLCILKHNSANVFDNLSLRNFSKSLSTQFFKVFIYTFFKVFIYTIFKACLCILQKQVSHFIIRCWGQNIAFRQFHFYSTLKNSYFVVIINLFLGDYRLLPVHLSGYYWI